ncbi:hypothetical protein JQ574_17585 [Bradyrhizobium sp. AUGA SZCCT0158]|uniref:hypothetical protein n=1 Tax=Bradyrhizobium sp. AUGA SZCCT0158 TaxID=2807661 RepID=UPI001BA8F008|nr:hypothetical protein [Bradyrhizobium sp. AUGA SZCCT0158]MBR1197811.1 hypothetical protein [Bradyrhizobium sp. AUGA SZCCT0158]
MKSKKAQKRRTRVSSDADPPDAASTNSAEETLRAWNDSAWKARLSWIAKPRLHTAIFEQFLETDISIEPADDAFPSLETKEAFYRQRKEMIEKIEDLKKRLDWDNERLNHFATLAVDFHKDPSIEKYLTIRQTFSEVDIQVGMSGGIDALFAIQKQCEQYGIDPSLVAGTMDGDEPDMDELSLMLMARIVNRNKIAGVGALQKRRAAISDAMVNYLIAFMLEGADWSNEEIRLPASLILLIRHQLGALKGVLHEEYRSRETKLRAAWIAGQQLKFDESLSINRLVNLTASVPNFVISRATAARWLKDVEFQKHLESSRKIKNSSEKLDLKPKK